MTTAAMETTFNTTSSNFDHTKNLDWIIPITVNVICMSASFWILISLLFHGTKTKKWKWLQESDYEKLSAGMVYYSVVTCSFTCCVYYISSLVFLNAGFNPGDDELCRIFYDSGVYLYVIVLLSGGVFGWFRQRVFYAHQMLNVNFNKVVRLFSFLCIFFIVICGIAAMILYVSSLHSKAGGSGCILEESDDPTARYFIFGLIVRLLSDIILLGLFLNALRQTKLKDDDSCWGFSLTNFLHGRKFSKNHHENSQSANEMEQSSHSAVTISNNDISTCSDENNSKISNRKIVRTIMIKTTFFEITLFFADMLLLALQNYVIPPGRGDHRRFITIMADINVILNVLFIIFSFVEWKKMLTSPCRR